MIGWKVLASAGLCFALSGCLYGNQQMLASLAEAEQCPFSDHVEYTAYTVQDNTPGEVIGQFTFVNDPNTGMCEVTDAHGVTQGGSGVLQNILGSQNKLIESGIYVSWVPAAGEEDAQLSLLTHYADGFIEIRGTCDGTDPEQTLVIPGVPREDGGDCHLQTEDQLRAFANGSGDVRIDYLFKPSES